MDVHIESGARHTHTHRESGSNARSSISKDYLNCGFINWPRSRILDWSPKVRRVRKQSTLYGDSILHRVQRLRTHSWPEDSKCSSKSASSHSGKVLASRNWGRGFESGYVIDIIIWTTDKSRATAVIIAGLLESKNSRGFVYQIRSSW